MSLTASPTPRRDRPGTVPIGRLRPNPPDERLEALAANLIEAFARISRRRF